VKLPWRKSHDGAARAAEPAPEPALPPELDAEDLHRLSTVFTPPSWLNDLGRTSWLLVGALVVVVGLAWLLGETAQIVNPVTAALIVAVVASPLVRALDRHMPRTAAAAVVEVGGIVLAVLIAILVVAGITSQLGAIGAQASAAADKAASWLHDAGVSSSGANGAADGMRSAAPKIVGALVHGVFAGVRGIASAAFTLSLLLLSLFFLLRDGPSMRGWVEGHLGLPPPVSNTIVGGVITSLRRYFRGVTVVAAFNGVVVFLGALVLDVPLAGTIGIVTFVTAYVPYIGAFAAGAFAVVIALGAKGTATALLMLLVVILANGLLQNLVQPFAMGAALALNPLVVMVVTIGAGCLFGTIGLVLAAPTVSAAVHITRDLARARELAAAQMAGAAEQPPTTAPV
jgi:predicted PurR-regulated permease PerM